MFLDAVPNKNNNKNNHLVRTPSCLNSEWSLSEVNMFLPPLGGGIFSSTKCLLYPLPVSRPITWRYSHWENRPVRFLIRTRGHIKSKIENTNVNLIIHLYVKSELCLKFRKYEPMGCRKAIKADQKGHRCTQKAPQRASKTRDATREIQKRSPGGGPRPQRPTKAEKYEKPIVKLMFLRKNIKFLK